MPDETQNVEEEAVQPQGEQSESPPEEQQTQETQTPTAEQGETQEQKQQGEVPFNEHPRFKELIEEKNWYKQQLELQAQRPQPQEPQTPKDPYSGYTPEEEKFLRSRDERARQIAKEEMQKMNPAIQAGLQEIASMKVQNFRKEYPDIKANSPEEQQIAGLINQGYEVTHAYWAVMGPKGVQKAEAQAVKKVKQNIQQKRQANVESSPGVAAVSQPKTDETIEETFIREAKEQGIDLPPSAMS